MTQLSYFFFFASNSPNEGPGIAQKDFQHNRKCTEEGFFWLVFNLWGSKTCLYKQMDQGSCFLTEYNLIASFRMFKVS